MINHAFPMSSQLDMQIPVLSTSRLCPGVDDQKQLFVCTNLSQLSKLKKDFLHIGELGALGSVKPGTYLET